jgi:hypothetical protein
MLEGNPKDPRDFHSVDQMNIRHTDCYKIATYLRSQGKDTSFFDKVFVGEQDPWEKLAENDVNKQMVQFKNPHTHFASEAAKQQTIKNNATKS